MTTTTDRSHRHFAAFTAWIAPEPSTRQAIVSQADEVRSRIKGQAEQDGLTVRATPNSGSFAKKTGLRRHMRGDLEIEGQDVDLPFVLKRTTDEGDRVGELLRRFDGYAKATYPTTPRTITKCSVELQFTGTGLRYDLVPMLATDKQDYQLILKSDGTRRLTSVLMHTKFVETRTEKSAAQPGRVKFNECVRLFKWWRYVRVAESGSIEKVSTFLIELLCASAFDRHGVLDTYTDTLQAWFSWLAHVAAKRTAVQFNDFPSIETAQGSTPSNTLWKVLDPVNSTNNLVPVAWGNIELSEFADWFADSRDAFNRILSLEAAGKVTEMEQVMKDVFGAAVITHGAA